MWGILCMVISMLAMTVELTLDNMARILYIPTYITGFAIGLGRYKTLVKWHSPTKIAIHKRYSKYPNQSNNPIVSYTSYISSLYHHY